MVTSFHKLSNSMFILDLELIRFSVLKKGLDANSYATKKTIAQGLLDVALLTANASQLKYVLQVGESHDFYSLMLGLIITSIALQLIQLTFCVVLGSKYNINKDHQQETANIANNIVLGINALIVGVNVFISAFEMKENFASRSITGMSTETTPITENFGKIS
ncbi:ninjurin-related [Holotrichia oblita]|uniref:Ninjurin-related n=1 Tax=Holotrichia oblita TaxID=644536 RepID=A0ACB9TQP2_HOLOL|nr:ninjurin-related [Holotrichia oblita]